jgi:hypothetical protein
MGIYTLTVLTLSGLGKSGRAHAPADPEESVMVPGAVAADLYLVRILVATFDDNLPIRTNQLAGWALPVLRTSMIRNQSPEITGAL